MASFERVEREVDVAAPADVVWSSVGDPARLGDWLDARVEGELAVGAHLEFELSDGEVRRAVVREREEGRRLVLWWWPADLPVSATVVTIAVEPGPDDRSRVRVTETRVLRLRAAA
jgi:uncharacterized protein YndB with AHSA1/START domain